MAQTGERFRMLLRVEATEKVTVARISVSTWSFGIRITGHRHGGPPAAYGVESVELGGSSEDDTTLQVVAAFPQPQVLSPKLSNE